MPVNQEPLFPPPESSGAPPPVDAGEIARQIGGSAGDRAMRVAAESDVRRAAGPYAELGGGVVANPNAEHPESQLPFPPSEATRPLRNSRRLIELPRQGRTNNPPPSRAELLRGMTPEEIAKLDADIKKRAAKIREDLGL